MPSVPVARKKKYQKLPTRTIALSKSCCTVLPLCLIYRNYNTGRKITQGFGRSNSPGHKYYRFCRVLRKNSVFFLDSGRRFRVVKTVPIVWKLPSGSIKNENRVIFCEVFLFNRKILRKIAFWNGDFLCVLGLKGEIAAEKVKFYQTARYGFPGTGRKRNRAEFLQVCQNRQKLRIKFELRSKTGGFRRKKLSTAESDSETTTKVKK